MCYYYELPQQQKHGCFFAPHSLGNTWSKYHASTPQNIIFPTILIIAVTIVYWLIYIVKFNPVLILSAYSISLKANIKATCGTIDTPLYILLVASWLLATI